MEHVWPYFNHYTDVITGTMASRITSLTIIYFTIYSGADQRKHQNSALLAFLRGIHRWPMNSPHKCPETRNMFPFDDVTMEVAMKVTFINFLKLGEQCMYIRCHLLATWWHCCYSSSTKLQFQPPVKIVIQRTNMHLSRIQTYHSGTIRGIYSAVFSTHKNRRIRHTKNARLATFYEDFKCLSRKLAIDTICSTMKPMRK